jgi:hypothetical protein
MRTGPRGHFGGLALRDAIGGVSHLDLWSSMRGALDRGPPEDVDVESGHVAYRSL